MTPTGRAGISFFLMLLFFSGCAIDHRRDGAALMSMLETYQEMSAELRKAPTFATYEPYLSKELQAAIRLDLGPNIDEHTPFLAPPLWFGRVDETYERHVGERHCLVVNGVSVDGDAISVALEYVSTDELMKVRAVEIAMFESDETLPAEGWCPVRADEF